MAADLALSAAQTLFAALQCKQLQNFCDKLLGYKSDLEGLKETVSTVKKVLIATEIRDGELSDVEEDYIMKLKDAVYDADDLFDKLLALSELEKYETGDILPVSPLHKVWSLFFSVNPLEKVCSFFSSANEIKVIMNNLEVIADNHKKFSFKFDSNPIKKIMPKETCSLFNKFEVIGREDETKAVVDMLLESSEEVGFLSIVGVGGLGKTTLAQLVYNDERIKREFSDSRFRFWVWVSDHDKEGFNVKVIISKILERFHVFSDKPTLQTVQEKFLETLGGQKCLIVLDDIWNEDPCKWSDLRVFFKILGPESRILVTTRSKESAKIIGKDSTRSYDLEGLSPKNSWRLFSLMASLNKQENDIPKDFVEIGHKIVEKCCRVPLALKVVGSLLCGKNMSEWVTFEHREVTHNGHGDYHIMSILKFSYLRLESPLKSCFKYCAIFPKDYRLNKEMLIRLWEAQAYIVPEKSQNIQDVGEKYFSILLNRCFFQDVEEDDFGEVQSCKIHDFMHNLAEEEARHDIWRSDYTRDTVGKTVRHLGHYKNGDTENFPFSSKIRSCLMYDTFKGVSLPADNCLRVLKLEDDNIETLPETIGNCLHLRSLDLSFCRGLRALPNSIVKLQSLQCLDISYCFDLKELPENLSELGKLKHLKFEGCHKFTHMPLRMDKLTCLTSLTKFIVNEGNDSSEDRHGELIDLQNLTELRGSISVLVIRYTSNAKKRDEGGYLKRLEHLKAVDISFEGSNAMNSDEEALMEKMQPHSNLRRLSIKYYNGLIIPKWGRKVDDWATLMPGLVEIELRECKKMKELPLLSRLRYLQKLTISRMPNLEYMEDITTGDATSEESEFFPSLCHLQLWDLGNLKGWWSNDKGQSCFPCLSQLIIRKCPNLVSSLCCPSLESLFLIRCNEGLSISVGQDVKLEDVNIDKLEYLWSKQRGRSEIVSTSEGEEELVTSDNTIELATVSGLRFDEDPQLWINLSHTLRHLNLWYTKAVSLPKGLQYLTNLQLLSILEWDNLESIAEWIGSLSSLRSLWISNCPKLKSIPSDMLKLTSLVNLKILRCSEELYQRCQEDPQGDDWRNICHVPNLHIRK